MTPSATTSRSIGEAAAVRSGRALGSPLCLTIGRVPDADDTVAAQLADAAWAAVISVFQDVDHAMSRFREDSELVGLCNASPEPRPGVSRTLVQGLSAADRAFRMTAGRFDPRIIGTLERIGYAGAPIAAGSMRSTREGTDTRVVLRQGRRGPVSLPVAVDLGGIGKGLAVRWSGDRVRRILGHVTGFLLEAGGDLVASGDAPQGGPWVVGIEDPRGGADPLAVFQIEGRGAVATSSIQRLRWVHDGQMVHHLIDPRTDDPGGEGLLAVTVAGPDPAWAEVWSKALFLEGAGGIGHAARRLGMATWWATEDGRIEMTPAARVRTVWVAGEA